MSGALAYRPDASQAALMFQIKEAPNNTNSLIEFLTDLHTHVDANKITLIWDNLRSHKSQTCWLPACSRQGEDHPGPGRTHSYPADEPHTALAAGRGQVVAGAPGVGAANDLPPAGMHRQPGQRGIQDGEMIGGGARPRVAGPQQPGQRLPGGV
jgi:hypothetical protein